MAEIAIIVLVVIIIYLYYAIFGGKPTGEPADLAQPETPAKAAEPKPKSDPKPEPKSKPKPKPKPATATSRKVKAPAEEVNAATELKNPKTGEKASIPNNYRFAKRWIKEALVEEGLLPKIYKNNELNDVANKKAKEALGRLTTIEKYKG